MDYSRQSESSIVDKNSFFWKIVGRQVCQLSSELFQNDKIVATATATAIIRKM